MTGYREVSKEIEFDAGHRVPLHATKCKNPHGHRYRVVAHILGELITEGPESGMVRDFSVIKELLTIHAHDKYDHGFIVHESDEPIIKLLADNGWKMVITPFYPTAECLAKAIFDDMKSELPNLFRIDVWETPTSKASYMEDLEVEL